MLFTFPSQYSFAIGLSVVFSLSGWSPTIQPEFLVFRPTQVPTGSLTCLRVRGSHPLRPGIPAGSADCPFAWRRSYNPGTCLATPPVWALPRSLAATGGIVFTFSSCGYLDVSVPHVRLLTSPGCRNRFRRVAPFGNPRVNGYLPLTVAYRSLSRPSSPPRAKASPMRPSFIPFSLHERRLMCNLSAVAGRPP